MTAYCTVAGESTTSVVVHIPGVGPWFAEVVFETNPDVSGEVEIRIGELVLSGTVDARHNGVFGLQRRCRVVAGANGWANLLPKKQYHNDGGVRAREVVEDAIRETGETLGNFSPAATILAGKDYVRQTGPASRVIEDVIGDVPWWVDYDGVTQVGARATSTPAAGSYEVLEFDPGDKIAVLAIDDLRAVTIGSILTERLESSETVRELKIEITSEAVRVYAWCGGETGTRGRLGDLFRAAVQRVTDRKLFGKYRYRVVQMSGDRVEMQPVRRDLDLPDLTPLSMWPGVAGAHAELSQGAEILIEFIEGDRLNPIVTGFAGKDGTGWAPVNLTIDITTLLKLGKDAAEFAAKANEVNDQFDDINSALDAFAAAIPVAMDGGVAIQTAFKGVWGTGVPPKPPSSVQCDKVKVQ